MKDFKVYIFFASLILVIYLVAEYKRPKPIDWTPSLLKTDKIPLGTYILYNELHVIFPGATVQTYREPIYNVINDHNINRATYLIICKDIQLNEYDYQKLQTFIKQGNDVFIAASQFGGDLEKKLKIETDEDYSVNQTPDSIHFLNKSLDPQHIYLIDKELQKGYFSAFDTTKFIALAQNKAGKSTFIKCNFGSGELYLNSDPQLFTNYSLLNPNGADYVSKSLSYLRNNKTLIWDDYYTMGREGDTSVMRVFFRKPALKWAYCITLVTLVLFVAFEAKRRQRIIPIIDPLKNSTLDFVNVVGQVYYEQRNNSNIAQKKAIYFLEHIRTKYHLKTSVLNEDFVTSLAQKSGVEAEFLHKLLNQIVIIRSGVYISDRDLISFNQNIEQFYIQSR